jgi:Protein of unknown function (DUF1554)
MVAQSLGRAAENGRGGSMNDRCRGLVFGAVAFASACTPFLGPLPPDGGDSMTLSQGSAGSNQAAGDGASAATGIGGSGASEGTSTGIGGTSGAGGSVASQDGGQSEVSVDVPSDSGGEVSVAVCGDGILAPPEECDLGSAANTGAYGKCTRDCKLAPYCGDGKVNDVGEICDDGTNNGFALGDCNPACSGLVKERKIRTTEAFTISGEISGVEDADIICETYVGSAYRALIVDGQTRVASTTSYHGDGQVGWVLLPYTRYVNAAGNLVWVTDSVALLGVRNGTTSPLLEPVVAGQFSVAWGGYEADWTTSTDNCRRWSSGDKADSSAVLRLDSPTVEIQRAECDRPLPLLCAERY